MNGLRITRNACGAWLIYIGDRLVFSSLSESRTMAYVAQFR